MIVEYYMLYCFNIKSFKEHAQSGMVFNKTYADLDSVSKIAATHNRLENLVLEENKNNSEGSSFNRDIAAGNSYRSNLSQQFDS